jgi:hypothetical protein
MAAEAFVTDGRRCHSRVVPTNHSRFRSVLWAGLLAGTGCAGMFVPVEQQPDFGQYFTMSMLGNTEQAKLEGPRLHGADLEVSRTAAGFRGVGRSGAVDLHAQGGTIAGTVGAGSTELHVEVEGGGLRIRGRYADKLSDLAVQPERVTGSMGRCHYDLQRAHARDPWYEGQRACGGSLVGVKLALPAALAALPAADRAALLAIFLASEEAPRSAAGLGVPTGDPRVPHHQPGEIRISPSNASGTQGR